MRTKLHGIMTYFLAIFSSTFFYFQDDHELKFLLKEVPEIDWDAIQEFKPSMPTEGNPIAQNSNNGIEVEHKLY